MIDPTTLRARLLAAAATAEALQQALTNMAEESAPDDEAPVVPPPPPPVVIPPPPVITPPTDGLTRIFYDEAASMAAGRFITNAVDGSPLHYAHVTGGCEIILPSGAVNLPAHSAIRLDRNANYQGPRTIRIVGQAGTVLTCSKGGFALINQTPAHVTFELSDFDLLSLSPGIDALIAVYPCDVILSRVNVDGGKNCLFSGHGNINIYATDCTFQRGGKHGSGYEHIIYLGYINDVSFIRCVMTSPVGPEGHALKCYSKWLELRGCTLSQGDLDEPGFDSISIPLDRGAWGETYAQGNVFVRNHPQSRQHFIMLQNRREPAPLRFVDDKTWGTVEVNYHNVDNRDTGNALLFKHLFTGNRFLNTADDKGVLVWNNGTAPWGRTVRGRTDIRPVPDDWKPHHERCVAYLHDNEVQGRPLAAIADLVPYLQRDVPGIITPLVEVDQLAPALLAMGERRNVTKETNR